MRIKRHKQVRKALQFYRISFGILPTYKILLDGNFIAVAVKTNVDFNAQIPMMLQTDNIEFCTTAGVIAELEALGDDFAAATDAARRLRVVECKYTESATHSIKTVVGPTNAERWFVATQDEGLRIHMRGIPGTPILALNRNVLFMEMPSDKSKAARAAGEVQKIDADVARFRELKAQHDAKVAEAAAQSNKKKRKRGPSGPNPLAMKKKQVKQEEAPAGGKKRNRRRTKAPRDQSATSTTAQSTGGDKVADEN